MECQPPKVKDGPLCSQIPSKVQNTQLVPRDICWMVELVRQNKNEMFIKGIVKEIEIQAGDMQKFKLYWQTKSEEDDYFVWGIG